MTTLETFEAAGPAGKLAGIAAGPTGGAALPVVLVHGINMSRDVWADVLEPLARSRRGVAFDLPGYRASDRSGPFPAGGSSPHTPPPMERLRVERGPRG